MRAFHKAEEQTLPIPEKCVIIRKAIKIFDAKGTGCEAAGVRV